MCQEAPRTSRCGIALPRARYQPLDAALRDARLANFGAIDAWYSRVVWDRLGSTGVDTMAPGTMRRHADLCGQALAVFAEAYADQNQRDYEALRTHGRRRCAGRLAPRYAAPRCADRSPGRTCRPARLYLACPDEGVRLFRTTPRIARIAGLCEISESRLVSIAWTSGCNPNATPAPGTRVAPDSTNFVEYSPQLLEFRSRDPVLLSEFVQHRCQTHVLRHSAVTAP